MIRVIKDGILNVRYWPKAAVQQTKKIPLQAIGANGCLRP